MDIWKIVSFLPIGGILVWLGNKIKNKFFPLGIKVDNENLNFVSARGTLRSLHSVEFYMNINFANRTSSNFNVLFSNINFYPKEKITWSQVFNATFSAKASYGVFQSSTFLGLPLSKSCALFI